MQVARVVNKKLSEAFVNGKRVMYRFTPWNDTSEPVRVSQASWNDKHAEVLAILLAGIPQQQDNKLRMDTIVLMADQICEVLHD